MPPTAYLFGLVLAVTAVAAVYDWRTGHIPNWLTLGAVAAGVVFHAGYGLVTGGAQAALSAAGFSVVGAVVCAAVPLLLYRFGAIGGGDVKLLAAMGALLRPMLGIEAELYAFIAIAIVAPGKLAYDGKLGAVLGNTLAIAKNPFLPKERRREVPAEVLTPVIFGPATFVGACGVALMHWSSL